MESRQKPVTAPSEPRLPSFPSLPTTRLRRSSSCAIRSLRSTTSLNTSATRPSAPGQFSGKRTDASPRFRAFRAPRITVISSAGSTARSTTCMFVLPKMCPGRRPSDVQSPLTDDVSLCCCPLNLRMLLDGVLQCIAVHCEEQRASAFHGRHHNVTTEQILYPMAQE